MTCAKNFFCLILSSSLILSSQVFAQVMPAPTTAPFATDGSSTVNASSQLMGIYDDQRQEDIVPLDKPHRTSEQISNWVEDNVTTAMNIDPTQWATFSKKLTPYFDPYGFQEYQTYLKASGIFDQLSANNMRLNAIADSSSVLLSEGALTGSYHWLYQIPMMLSYYDRSITTAKSSTRIPNQKVMVRVQIGRVKQGPDDNNVVIERWSVTPLR